MSIRPVAVALAAAVLGACSPASGPADEQAAVPTAPANAPVETAPPAGPQLAPGSDPQQLADTCNADPVQDLVGETWDQSLEERARTGATANSVRLVRPDQAVTMDYRGDRLNVLVDADGRITELRCG